MDENYSAGYRRHTNENGAHCVIAHENPVMVIKMVAPVTLDVKLHGNISS